MNFQKALERWIRANLWGLPPRSPRPDQRGQDTPAGDEKPAGPGKQVVGELRGPGFVLPAQVRVPQSGNGYVPIRFKFEKRFHPSWNLATIEFSEHQAWAEAYNSENDGKLGTDGSNLPMFIGATAWGARADGSKWSFSDVTVGGKGGRGRWYEMKSDRWYYCGNTVDDGASIEFLSINLPLVSNGSPNATTFEKEIDDQRYAWGVSCYLEIDGKKSAYNGNPVSVLITDQPWGQGNKPGTWAHPAGTLPSPSKPHEVAMVIEWGRPYRPDTSRYYEDISGLIRGLAS